MHFLGLSGMPRRIPDYPDCFWYWNKVVSLGHCCTTLSLFVFILSLIFFDARGLPTKVASKGRLLLKQHYRHY